ncbi:MAG: molybdenum cofactor guanylyltransferase [Caulobacteraceae bacterium]
MIAGLALAGGRSRRFGTEKAVALVGGEPMLQRVLELLRPCCTALAASARLESGAAMLAVRLGVPVLHDAEGDPEGPLAGISAGLAWAEGIGAARLLVAPCDTPFLPADYAARLLATDPAMPAVAVAGGELQPLCSVWPTHLLADVKAALADGHPAVHAMLTRLGATQVAFEDASAFRNINRIEDLD